MLQLLNKFFPILDTLYFLQLTNYDTKIFLTKAHYFYTRKNLQVRDKLVFTNKVKLILAGYILILVLIALMFQFWTIVLVILTPYLIVFINFMLQFLTQIREDIKLKNLKLRDKKDLKIVLLTGSQGKTTLKYMMYNAVKAFCRTQIIPDNINTTSGVVNWLSQNLLGNTELLIFETEPFYVGEMTKIIKAFNPKFRIITNLTDQHLMRFGSLEQLHNAYLEISKDSQNCHLLSAQNVNSDFEFVEPRADQLQFVDNINEPSYLATYLTLCERVLRELNVETKFQIWSPDWLKDLPLRRKNITTLWGHEVIDDSYNVSLESAKSSIEFALKYANKQAKKLIIITAGIPESSRNPADANIEFGKYLRIMIEEKMVNVILLQSEFYPFIKNQVTTYQATQNLNGIASILKMYNALECTVLFLPELNDFYY